MSVRIVNTPIAMCAAQYEAAQYEAAQYDAPRIEALNGAVRYRTDAAESWTAYSAHRASGRRASPLATAISARQNISI